MAFLLLALVAPWRFLFVGVSVQRFYSYGVGDIQAFSQ